MTLTKEHSQSAVSTESSGVEFFSGLQKLDSLTRQKLQLDAEIAELRNQLAPEFMERSQQFGFSVTPPQRQITNEELPPLDVIRKANKPPYIEPVSRIDMVRGLIATHLGKEFSRKELEVALKNTGNDIKCLKQAIKYLLNHKEIKSVKQGEYEVIKLEVVDTKPLGKAGMGLSGEEKTKKVLAEMPFEFSTREFKAKCIEYGQSNETYLYKIAMRNRWIRRLTQGFYSQVN